MMDAIQRLTAIEDIRLLKARYWRCIDQRRWDEYRSFFTEDAVFDFDETGGEMAATPFIDWTVAFLDTSTTIHHGYAPEITLLSDDEADGIWAFDDQIYWPAPTASNQGLASLIGAGHYNDRYHREDGVWKIARVRVTRLRLTTTSHQLSIS